MPERGFLPEALATLIHVEASSARIVLQGSFDLDFHREFAATLPLLLQGIAQPQIVLDFERVAYMDTRGLGLLLELRLQCEAHGKTLLLVNCCGRVKHLLETANFDRLFDIDPG